MFQDLSHAQHHSIYIPNYLQAFDYPNGDETALPSHHPDQLDYHSNDGLDSFLWDWVQTTTAPPAQFFFETSNSDHQTTMQSSSMSIIPTTQATTIIDSTTKESINSTESLFTKFTQNSTSSESINVEDKMVTFVTTMMSIVATNDETSTFQTATTQDTKMKESTSHQGTYSSEVTSTLNLTELIENLDKKMFDESDKKLFSKQNSDLIASLFNRTILQSKYLIDEKQPTDQNMTSEEVAKSLSDRKMMQSLIHLLPPNLWSQFQTNFSMNAFNQSQYAKSPLSNPVLSSEAATKTGLPGSGPHHIPDHIWYQNANYYRNQAPVGHRNPITKASSICTYY